MPVEISDIKTELTLVTVKINFEFGGRSYDALIVPLSGAGAAAHFFVMVDQRFMGQLFYSEQHDGQFFGNQFQGRYI